MNRLKLETAGKLPHHFLEELIDYVYPDLVKENWRMSTSDRGEPIDILVFASPTGNKLTSMIGENRQAVTDEPVKFEK